MLCVFQLKSDMYKSEGYFSRVSKIDMGRVAFCVLYLKENGKHVFDFVQFNS